MTTITRIGEPLIVTCPPRRPWTPDELAMTDKLLLQEAVETEVQEIGKHAGGTGHDQKTHGNWARGSDSGIPFDGKGELRALSIPDRKTAWEALSVKERDAQANPVKTIGDRITEVTKPLGDWQDSGDLKADVAARVKKAGDLIPADSQKLISDHMQQLADELAASGVDAKLARKITTEATDALIAQDYESLGRTLGDHGARHLMQDADYTMAQMRELSTLHPGLDVPEMRAAAILTAVYHDAGYMTPASRAFLDEGHPRWSQDYFDAKIGADIEAAFGRGVRDLVSLTIASHDSIRMDWARRPFSSAFRLSDNLGLFHAEKLPPFMHNVPKNVGVIARLGRDLAQPNADVGAAVRRAQSEARANIEAQPGLSSQQRLRMLDAVEEISPILPKLSLGMVGGRLTGFTWNQRTGTMEATAQRSHEADDISRVIDVGQRQFIKLAETYNVDPASVRQDNRMDFDADGDGVPDFSLTITGQLLKHLMGQHDQKTHGNRGNAKIHDWGDDTVRAALGVDALHPEQQFAIDATLAKYDITQEALDAQTHALAEAVLGDKTQADLDKMPDAWKPEGMDWYDEAATETVGQFKDQGLSTKDIAFQAQVAIDAALSPNLAWDQKSTRDVEGWLRTENGTVAINSRLAAVVTRSWVNNDEVVITQAMIDNEKLRGMGLTVTTPGTYRLRDLGPENAGAVMGKALHDSPLWGDHTRQMSGQNYAHAFRIAEAARTHSPDLIATIDRELAGPKVRNFYNALVSRGQWDGGTIDVHMVRGMLPRGSTWPTEGHPSIPYPAVGGSHGRGGTKPSGSTLSSGAAARSNQGPPLLDASTRVRRDGRGVVVRGQAIDHLEAVSREARAAWLDDAGVYPAFQTALLREARARGMKVSDLQAIIWYFIRNGGRALA